MAKICVTIGRGRHRSMLDEWKAAAEAGAELVELRIDCLRREVDLKRILAERYTPLVLTIRRAAEGGMWRGPEDKRHRLLREAIAAGVDYVDLEDDVAGSIPRFGKTRRIVSHHAFKKFPDDLEDLARRMRDAKADIVKIAATARNLHEAARMVELVRDSDGPTIGLAMGALGFFTRIVGARFGSPFTYAGFNPDRIFAPGMPQFRELREDYAYEGIDAGTELYAVIGDPIGHSLSPAIHNTAFAALKMKKRLIPLQIPAGTLKESFQPLHFLDLRGISVTIPHKEAILSMLHRSDQSVDQIGACNTVVVDAERRWVGHNTDFRAAVATLEAAMGGLLPGGLSPLMDKQVLILGAGGVARAIAFGLSRRGAGVTIANRHDDRAVQLAEDVGCRSVTWAMRAGTLCDILVNCTPVGMHPNVDESPVPPAAFRPNMIVFDTVYRPENTLLLKLAHEHDCITISGVDMFVRQAGLQFEYYTGHEPPLDLMRQVVKRRLSAVRD
jgi:3-dehydroquinate dehydratase/shikimate dehydrogenase